MKRFKVRKLQKNMVKKLNKKAEKVLNKLLGITECPHCKENLLENGIGQSESGTKFYTVGLDDGHLTYEEDEFQNDNEGVFFCKGCGKNLDYSGKEVIEILGMKKE